MKIAQIAPLFESVPPRHYGGTERVVSYLTEELVRQGHEVTLFASGDSDTAATLVAPVPVSGRPQPGWASWLPAHCVELDMVMERIAQFDVLHFHTDLLHFPLVRRTGVAHVTTLHWRLDLPELAPLFHHFNDVPVVSISRQQQSPLPHARWVGTVHHGLPGDQYRYGPGDGGYFLFIGRFSPEKRVDRAIEIAQHCGTPLYVAAKIDETRPDYFEKEVRPLLDRPFVRYVGEIGEREKRELLGGALALLSPIDWPEPFGLVLIEALACGTPVIAYRNGAVPEILDDGVTGFIVENQEQAVEAACKVHALDRRACRDAFERRFTAERMAANYLQIYRALQDRHSEAAPRTR
ncbi:MAG TPA: glycosyltransferase family 4 protein [Noviherbaspirillum sp.]|nr:glycosyltransferase family 4 protein [Noviherbaspirillum sp.]